MGVTWKNHSDFFVYTHFGMHQEWITLNLETWKNILQRLELFWYKYQAPEILSHKLHTPTEIIALHDQAQAQPGKLKTYSQKKDSAASPIQELLTQNALKWNPKNDSPSKPVKKQLCFTTCKNDFGLSDILDPAQSKAVKKKFWPCLKCKEPYILLWFL